MGCTDSPLPEPLLRNPEVNCLLSNGHDEPYNDNLCLFRAIAIHLFGSVDVELQAIKIFYNFVTGSGCDPDNFTGVSFDQIPIIEELIKQNIFIYDFDIEDGEKIGELVRSSVDCYDENIERLRYNNHIYYVNDINNFFKKFRCPSCDVFFNHSGHFNRHLKTCKERVKNIYPRGAYSLRETLFEKLDNFSIAYPEDKSLFRNLWSIPTSKKYVFNQWKSITQRQHHGLVIMYLYRYQSLQICWTNQFSYAEMILIVSSYPL